MHVKVTPPSGKLDGDGEPIRRLGTMIQMPKLDFPIAEP